MRMSALFFILFSPPVWALSPSVVQQNNRALENLEEKKSFEAYQQLLKALGDDPFQPELHLNLGLVFESNKEWDKAFNENMSVLRLPKVDPALQFAALFNAARVATEKKDIPKALELYQKALEIAPNSVEVKTNIELLWQGQGDGEGEGSGQPNQDNKDGKGQGESPDDSEKDQNQDGKRPDDQQGPQKKPQPKPFESKELSQDDVRKIMEELTSQEQKIRAKDYGKEVKERPRDKDW